MVRDELAEHLHSLMRDECYRVAETMKETPFETTEKVYFVGQNGSEQGPFVRKYLSSEAGLGSAYEKLFTAQKSGRRFQYLPHIIECYSVGANRVVVMEYVSGETLQNVLYRCDPSVALAVDIFPRLCDAVTELHGAFNPPIIHRDLKPSNIMLSRDNLTIIDFGIARSFKEDSEQDTHRFGTKAFAPPEQFGFGQTDERSDVYALGMLLYYCLTEEIPSMAIRNRGFESPKILPSIRLIIERAASFSPADRFQSADLLKESFLEANAVPAPREAPITLGSQSLKPNQAFQLSTSPQVLETQFAFTQKNLRKANVSILGVVWNILVIALFVLFIAVAVSLTFDPKEASIAALEPLWIRAVQYFTVVFFVFGPWFYFVLDRRPLRKALPRLPRLPLWKELIFCLALCFVGVLIIGICTVAPR